MIVTWDMLAEKYKDYSDVKGKIRREVEAGNLVHLRHGLYETDPNADGACLACRICSPSYLSFDYVLSYYDLIPEAVIRNYSSATFRKRKTKLFANSFGNYRYRDVPDDAYPYGIDLVSRDGYKYMMATPEKALCDKLYTLPNLMHNLKEVENMLFEDLRIDEIEFAGLDKKAIREYAPRYHSKALDLFVRYLDHNGL
ncbi:MAG: hypothetical protein LUD50_02520 [Clostridia bacterium]|nr:hypothetical protein [Clostridia bacterium]